MSWSVSLGRIAGTTVRIHLTFLILLLWIWGASYVNEGPSAAWEGLLFTLAVFACVLTHEFGHILTARAFGIATPDVTLLPIGGVARLDRIPEDPYQELPIAAAGPLVNVVIALILLTIFGNHTGLSHLGEIDNPRLGFVDRLILVNFFLAIFNLIPAFPMDGGRVLRALLGMRMGYVHATRIAASIGQGLAFFLGLSGLFFNPLLIFIGLFVYFAAGSESQMVSLRAMSHGVPVTAAMMTKFVPLRPDAHINEAIDLVLQTNQTTFPVVENDRLMGLLDRTDIVRALKNQGPDSSVGAAMTHDIATIDRARSLEDAVKILEGGTARAIGVIDSNGRLLGLFTLESLGEIMTIGAAVPGFRFLRGTAKSV